MKGYVTSTDYKKLWDLINSGHRVPAWILHSKKSEEPIFDIAEVKMPKYGNYPSIGVRGLGYASFENTIEAFIENCEFLKLQYIMPLT
jgi:hypothetical protein